MSGQPIIAIQDLTVGFGERTVLDGLSLDVNRGEILGLVPPKNTQTRYGEMFSPTIVTLFFHLDNLNFHVHVSDERRLDRCHSHLLFEPIEAVLSELASSTKTMF